MRSTLVIVFFYQTGYDALEAHNNMQFSTFDVDNDRYRGNCATTLGNGGNWFNSCASQNLNGVYGADGNTGGKFMSWRDFDTGKYNSALKTMRWMMREAV